MNAEMRYLLGVPDPEPSRFLDDQAYRTTLLFGPYAETLPEGTELPVSDGLFGETRTDADLGNPYASGNVVTLPSGHVAYEVSDAHRHPLRPKTGLFRRNKPVPLEQIIPNSQDLFEAYPVLRELPVHSEEMEPGHLGYFTPDDPAIYMNKELSDEEYRRTLLHELQHAIDALGEGRPVGGYYASNMRGLLANELNAILSDIRPPLFVSEDILAGIDNTMRRLFDIYEHDQGETIARAADTRADLNPEELATIPYRDSLDVLPENVNVFDGEMSRFTRQTLDALTSGRLMQLMERRRNLKPIPRE